MNSLYTLFLSIQEKNMILDNIKNVACYNFPKEMTEVVDFLHSAPSKAEGRYDLSNGIFALVQEYTTVCASECRLENHKKYIDLQYIVSGVEQIGIAFEADIAEAYNEEKDIAFFNGDNFLVTLREGDFAILFPQDLHMPKVGNGGAVKKVVIKIPVEIFR